MPTPASRIAVVGGSLGGLTAASLLRDAGHDVTIYERSPVPLEQRGAGIGLLEATYRYPVERAGSDLERLSVHTNAIRTLHDDGSVAVEQAHRYRFSSWNTIYRSLVDDWLGHDPTSDRHRLGHLMTSFEDRGTEVEVRFENGAATTVDLLVCTDGVGSTGRRLLQPSAERRYAGYVAWRGTVPEAELTTSTLDLLGDAITYHVHTNSHILVYPIPSADGSVEPGQRLINFVWYRNYAEGTELDQVLTDRLGRRRELSIPPGLAADDQVSEVRAEAEARLPTPIAEVVRATDEPFVQAIFDIEVDALTFGRACLVGDAGFAVRPHAAAGSAKACEDGWQLARALDEHDDLDHALAVWQTRQMDLGRDLLERTRRIGRRSQVDNDWQAGDPDLIFGLYGPGN
ncbi:MAG: NAD(P)-binding protein [Actinomycetota bacterium]